MRKIAITAAVAALVFLTACNQGSGQASNKSESSSKAGIEVVLDGKALTFEPTSTGLLTSAVTDSVSHTFVLMNYELGKKLTKMTLHKSAKQDGRKRLQFTIIGENGAGADAAIKPGEYATNVGNAGSPFGKTTDARFSFSEGGKENSRGLNAPDIKAGKVVITSVEGGVIKGTVDVTDGTLTIKGPFEVKVSESV